MEQPIKRRVLIADDERPIRELCARSLRGLGCEVTTAESGEAALAAFAGGGFDLVLTDLAMPGKVDGVRLCSEIKSRSPSTDVVIMTAYPTLGTAIATLKTGAYDYLVKPFEPQVLEAVAARCFEKRRLSAELDREKLLRRELEAAYSELQKLERFKNAFLDRLHHELRTPLTIALTSAELAGKEGTGPEGHRNLQDMTREKLSQLREILEDLLLYAQMHSHDLRLERSAVHVPELMAKLAARYRPLWEEKGLKVDISFAGPFPVLSVDPGLLETALKHLLLNAIHFNQTGGSVMVRGETSAGEARISFRDTGLGITEDQLPRLFGGFYQAADHLTRKVGGLGLGLAIVRRIAEAHGGQISVRSENGKGSEFILVLPAAGRITPSEIPHPAA